MFLTQDNIDLVKERLKPLGFEYSPSYFYDNWYSKFIYKTIPKKWVRKLFKIKVDNQITNFISKFGFDISHFSTIIEKEKEKEIKTLSRKQKRNINFFNKVRSVEYRYEVLGHYRPLGAFKSYHAEYPILISYHFSIEAEMMKSGNINITSTFYDGPFQMSMISKNHGEFDLEEMLSELIVYLCASDPKHQILFREDNINNLLEEI